MGFQAFSVIVFALAFSFDQVSVTHAADATLIPDTGGCEVIEAVLTKIEAAEIFDEDNGFLRRLAYVETRAGQSPSTKGNGPWAVTESMLQATQVNVSDDATDYMRLHPLRYLIWNSTKLRDANNARIVWRDVTFEQLRQPLFSALASRVYLHLLTSRSGSGVSLRLDSQATFWSKNFAFGSVSSQEETRRIELFVNRTRSLDDQCGKLVYNCVILRVLCV